MLKAIPYSVQRREPWANGAGETRVIARGPVDDEHWAWRISVARDDLPCEFSALPGTRRWLAPLDAAIELRFPDDRALHAARLGVLRFDGEPAPRSLLPGGPTRAFNLMLRGDARGELLARPLVGSMVLLPEPGARWLVYIAGGRATLRAEAASLVLDTEDAAWIDFCGPADSRVSIEGGGEIVLVKLYA